ncbi:hypothetical protein H8K35_17470 [Undibacterium sp. LX40W]|uniref:Uncharacterized protein n=1 Tax=Undibacterium nitidum TaxID=2762298 RepID=A0A923HSB8_9BURK|nr:MULTISPECIES: hypothetical protein [Undibacterium]MBC3883191.1 hypothetical protein [Undibacterium nitidum]MBC3893473.1 hypothetical protein [Undibacterium sp. LX40W]
MKKISVVLMMFFCVLNVAYAEKKKPETTTVDQITFTNEMFDFSIKKPETWVAQNTTDLLALQQKGSALMAGDNKTMKAALDRALDTSLPLFSFLSHPLGTKGQAIISVVSAAENVKAAPVSLTACDYLEHVKTLMAKAAVKSTMSDKCQVLDTGNAKLSYFDSKMEVNGVVIQQRFHACRKSGYMVNVVQSFLDESGRQQTTDIVKTLKIRCD